MTFDFEEFAKASEGIINQHKGAVAEGRKLGWLQDLGVFLSPDAPAHIRNQRVPLMTPGEWQALADSQAEDPLNLKFGPGATIMNLYYSPSKGIHAKQGDPPSPLLAMATAEDLDRLWTAYFQLYPDPRSRVGTNLFLAAVREEAKRRGIK